MGQSVGELFINLGIKGSEKTVGALSSIKKGLGEIGSTSLEVKAGLVGAMYALEQMFAASGRAGTSLTNFSAVMGVNAKTLQEYQYAARQAGVSNEETAATFKTLQSSMEKILLGEAPPKRIFRVAELTGAISEADIRASAKAPELFYQRLQQYAKKETNAALFNEVMGSFAIPEGTRAALRRQMFTPENLKRAPTYSEPEIGNLNRANIAWQNLGNQIEMAIGHFNAKHGLTMVKDIAKITQGALDLANALETVSEKFKIFENLGHVLEGMGNSLKLISELKDKFEGKESKPGDLLYNRPEDTAAVANSPLGKGVKSAADFAAWISGGRHIGAKTLAAPPVPAGSPGATNHSQTTINQNLNFQHEGTDHKKNADSHKKALQDAFRQLPQGQAS